MKTDSSILIKLLFSCVVVLSINSCNIEEINTPIEENYQKLKSANSLWMTGTVTMNGSYLKR